MILNMNIQMTRSTLLMVINSCILLLLTDVSRRRIQQRSSSKSSEISNQTFQDSSTNGSTIAKLGYNFESGCQLGVDYKANREVMTLSMMSGCVFNYGTHSYHLLYIHIYNYIHNLSKI